MALDGTGRQSRHSRTLRVDWDASPAEVSEAVHLGEDTALLADTAYLHYVDVASQEWNISLLRRGQVRMAVYGNHLLSDSDGRAGEIQ